MRILVTGGTGFIGRELVRRLVSDGHEIRVLSRDARHATEQLGVPAFAWDYTAEPVPAAALDGVEGIVHLMGENLGQGRWTDQRKREILASRVLSTRKLVDAAPDSLRVLVCGSAIGIYPGQGDELYDESYVPPADATFLQAVCRDWEAEAARVERGGVRRVSVRIGVVLGAGGMLGTLMPLFKLGMGGPVGDGRQWLPWIHLQDVVCVLANALTDERYRGPVNAVAPHPVRYRDFARALGKALNRPAIMPTPAVALKLALGEAAVLALNSYRVAPRTLLEQVGFAFSFPDLDTALAQIVAG